MNKILRGFEYLSIPGVGKLHCKWWIFQRQRLGQRRWLVIGRTVDSFTIIEKKKIRYAATLENNILAINLLILLADCLPLHNRMKRHLSNTNMFVDIPFYYNKTKYNYQSKVHVQPLVYLILTIFQFDAEKNTDNFWRGKAFHRGQSLISWRRDLTINLTRKIKKDVTTQILTNDFCKRCYLLKFCKHYVTVSFGKKIECVEIAVFLTQMYKSFVKCYQGYWLLSH